MTQPTTSLDTSVRIAVAVVLRGREVLVGIRPAYAPLAGYAEFPGGKCALQETVEQAAVRECFEETGLVVQARRILCQVEHSYPHGRVHVTFIECQALPLNEPRPPFKWVPISHLRQMKFPEANKPVLQILEQEMA